MKLVVQKKPIHVRPSTWFSADDLVLRALAVSHWPKRPVFLDWGMGYEPIKSLEELHFAARLVQAYHCHDMQEDGEDLVRLLEETRIMEEETEKHMQEESDDDDETRFRGNVYVSDSDLADQRLMGA